MSLKFSPGVLWGGGFYELPRPVNRVQIQDHWDYSRYQVLLNDGDATRGLSRKGVDINVSGNIASQSGDLLVSEAEMFAAIEELRQIFCSQAESLFVFYLYRDAVSKMSRYFQKCSVSRFQYDISQPELYSYTLTLHADDPVLYSSWLEE